MPSLLNTWIPFLYLYGVGGIFFFAGLIIVKKSGSLDTTRKSHKRWMKIMLWGFFYFMFIHAFLIIAALYW
ncbi:MAG: hypothetical protein KF721_05100 [Ignavibacteriaceae bacterium]|nr:hypothetical protein [Ignavibacteriaceae bacterium]HRI45907.1 hypothetical protein [Ignavibacteriaceae bacterium]